LTGKSIGQGRVAGEGLWVLHPKHLHPSARSGGQAGHYITIAAIIATATQHHHGLKPLPVGARHPQGSTGGLLHQHDAARSTLLDGGLVDGAGLSGGVKGIG
jgi:hypothetical protein